MSQSKEERKKTVRYQALGYYRREMLSTVLGEPICANTPEEK
ncbi:hypothetical protein [Leptolyngbya ectocarpi]|nr:hypothetical protein [Leptolyngbya ectocarpi]